MDNSLANGYVKWLDESASGSTRYILHHGVYHPNKPGKIRVLYDYIVKFQGKPHQPGIDQNQNQT